MIFRLLLLAICMVMTGVPAPQTSAQSELPPPVSAQDLARLGGGGDAGPYILDIRSETDFQAGTLPGAVHGGTEAEAFMPTWAGGEVVLVTAGGGDDPADLPGWTERLSALGFTVLRLEGGFEAWRGAGLTVVQPYADPGRVPFVIPRGICEHLPPVQEY